MIHTADLHIHTTASDGQYSPREIVRMAKDAGIECIAITDHDTLNGVDEAVRAGEEYGVAVLRGIELGAREERHLHIVGLGIQPPCAELEALCRKLRMGRDERNVRIIAFLKEKGVYIDLEEVVNVAGGDVVARPHFAEVMVRHGYVSSRREAFDWYLDTSEYQKIERFKADAAHCIAAIHQAGGKAVLAHPSQLGLSEEKLDEVIGRLKVCGLDAIECYYPTHTPDMEQQYLTLAEKYDLYVSGGSDFHGERVHADRPLRPILLEVSWLLQRMEENII